MYMHTDIPRGRFSSDLLDDTVLHEPMMAAADTRTLKHFAEHYLRVPIFHPMTSSSLLCASLKHKTTQEQIIYLSQNSSSLSKDSLSHVISSEAVDETKPIIIQYVYSQSHRSWPSFVQYGSLFRLMTMCNVT